MNRTGLLLLCTLLSFNVFASDINSCENSPETAVTELPEPYSSWIKIECDAIRKSHFSAAHDDYNWAEINTGKAYRFDAYGPTQKKMTVLEMNIYEPHKYHFVKVVPSVMNKQQIPGVNELLPEKAGKYDEIHQLDLNTNTKNIYSLFIYIQDESPRWIVACVNYQCGTRASIEVTAANN